MARLQWFVFGTICIFTAVILLWKAWSIQLLYTDPLLRERVQTEIQGTAHREGWLLSDINLTKVDLKNIWIIHQGHVRGEDKKTCYTIALQTGLLSPCS